MPIPAAAVRRIRRGLIAVLAVGTTGLAVVLVFQSLNLNRVAITPTDQLVAILAMLLLPVCTISAWAWDRSIRDRYTHTKQGHRDDDAFEPDRVVGEPDAHRSVEHPAGRTRPHTPPPADEPSGHASLSRHKTDG